MRRIQHHACSTRKSRFSGVSLLTLCIVLLGIPAWASNLRISVGSNTRLPTEVEADYTTSHIFINEVAHDAVPITIFFDPQSSLSPQDKAKGIERAEVFTN